eukprot:CAMPEP_0114501188 /NCGR_PEP_ID=MMETSP0109-20121206/8365_1 /TAXON_ID=29199 /ORGANISM="Chlorarachnion reptans, Strain CCCM449" /LENGTH=412 /DNA_ID=CAMNT_0001678901 /DNA_START=213 /DNA_END=1448 /DNA_ORIENTATION=-
MRRPRPLGLETTGTDSSIGNKRRRCWPDTVWNEKAFGPADANSSELVVKDSECNTKCTDTEIEQLRDKIKFLEGMLEKQKRAEESKLHESIPRWGVQESKTHFAIFDGDISLHRLLSEKYLARAATIRILIDGRSYTIDFIKMLQINVESGFSRRIRLRVSCGPVWEWEDQRKWKRYSEDAQRQISDLYRKHNVLNMQIPFEGEIERCVLDIFQMKLKIVDKQIERKLGVKSLECPRHSWKKPPKSVRNSATTKITVKTNEAGTDVCTENHEFNLAFAQFMRSLKGKRDVSAISIYESPVLEYRYREQLKKMSTELSTETNAGERWVFHGTNKEVVEQIMIQGFKIGGEDIRVRNGSMFGKGVYTSTSAGDALQYADGKVVILSRAILGNHGEANSDVHFLDSWTPKNRPKW